MIRIIIQQGLGRHDHTRCAETALHTGMHEKGLLNRVQLLIVGKTLYGYYFLPIGLCCRDQTAIDSFTIHDHRTGAALPLTASFLGTGQIKPFPYEFQEGLPGLHPQFIAFIVKNKPYLLHFH